MSANIFILGGYGNTGLPTAELLLQFSEANVILAGRNQARAEAAASRLNQQYATDRVRGMAADASDYEALLAALRAAEADIVVVASSTTQYTETIARAALDAGADYLDVQISSEKLETLRALDPQIRAANRCFITDGGFHPGLPAAMVRYAASCFDTLHTANVGSVIKLDWASLEFAAATVEEMVLMLNDFDMRYLADGRWKQAGMNTVRYQDYGPPFGRQYAMPMMLEEMRSLPGQIPGLQNTGFFVGGFNPFVDFVAMPVMMVAQKIAPRRTLRPMSRLMEWGLKTFSRPPYGTLLQLDAAGERGGEPATLRLTIRHVDGYLLTAAPMVACLLQVMDGSVRQPGLHFQAHLMEPGRAFADLRRMGITVEETAG